MRWQQKDARKKRSGRKTDVTQALAMLFAFFFARDILLMLCLTADRWWMLRRRLYELAERQVWMVWMVWIVWDEMKSKKSKAQTFFEETKQMSLINFLWIDMNQWLLSWFMELTVSTAEYEQWIAMVTFQRTKSCGHSWSSGKAFEDAVREIDNLGEEGAKEICHSNFQFWSLSDASKASQDYL